MFKLIFAINKNKKSFLCLKASLFIFFYFCFLGGILLKLFDSPLFFDSHERYILNNLNICVLCVSNIYFMYMYIVYVYLHAISFKNVHFIDSFKTSSGKKNYYI